MEDPGPSSKVFRNIHNHYNSLTVEPEIPKNTLPIKVTKSLAGLFINSNIITTLFVSTIVRITPF